MEYTNYLIGLVILGAGFVYFMLRRRAGRRHPTQQEIPAFLRKDGAHSSNGGPGDTDAKWTEIFPARKR